MNIKDGVLSLEAQRKINQEAKNSEYREFGPVDFKTSIRLPEDIVEDSIQAQFQNGILKISIQKAKKSNIQIEIK